MTAGHFESTDQPADTGNLGDVVSLQSRQNLKNYRAIAVAAMPHLDAYYEAWAMGVHPDDASYTAITSELLAEEDVASSSAPWLDGSGNSTYSESEIADMRDAVSKELLVAEDSHVKRMQGKPLERGSYIGPVLQAIQQARLQGYLIEE